MSENSSESGISLTYSSCKGKISERNGVFSGVSVTVSTMIGSGIFATPSKILKLAGSPLCALLLWLFGGVMTIGGSLSFSEMSTMYPRNAGQVKYVAKAYETKRAGPAFIVLWCLIMCSGPGMIAANCTLATQYLLFGAHSLSEIRSNPGFWYRNVDVICRVGASITLTIIIMLFLFLKRSSLVILGALATFKILLISGLASLGILALMGAMPYKNPQNWSRDLDGTNMEVGPLTSAMYNVLWCYEGWATLSQSAGEMRNPKRTVPLSATAGVVIVIVLYVMLNVAYYTVVPFEILKRPTQIVAAVYTTTLLGPYWGQNVLPVLIGITVIGTIFAQVYGVSKIIDGSIDMGFIPRIKSSYVMYIQFGTRAYALFIIWAMSLVYIVLPPPGETFDLLLDVLTYPTWFIYGFAVLGCVILRKRYPSKKRSFRSSIYASILFFIVCITLSGCQFMPDSSSLHFPYWYAPVFGTLLLLLGIIPWYTRMVWWPKYRGRMQPALELEENEILEPTDTFPQLDEDDDKSLKKKASPLPIDVNMLSRQKPVLIRNLFGKKGRTFMRR